MFSYHSILKLLRKLWVCFLYQIGTFRALTISHRVEVFQFMLWLLNFFSWIMLLVFGLKKNCYKICDHLYFPSVTAEKFYSFMAYIYRYYLFCVYFFWSQNVSICAHFFPKMLISSCFGILCWEDYLFVLNNALSKTCWHLFWGNISCWDLSLLCLLFHQSESLHPLNIDLIVTYSLLDITT